MNQLPRSLRTVVVTSALVLAGLALPGCGDDAPPTSACPGPSCTCGGGGSDCACEAGASCATA